MAILVLEFVLLFVAAPAFFAFTRHRIPAIPALWVITAYCLLILLRDPHFERERLWDSNGFRQYASQIFGLFALIAVIGTALVLRFAPASFLNLPRSSPLLWGAVMILYPVLSVYPQGIVYRAFVFERYGSLFAPAWLIVFASAAAFGYLHIVFRNWVAVGLTFAAGLLFAFRYLQTGSLLISSFEHALYGCAVFTVGLGRWFYHGAVRR